MDSFRIDSPRGGQFEIDEELQREAERFRPLNNALKNLREYGAFGRGDALANAAKWLGHAPDTPCTQELQGIVFCL